MFAARLFISAVAACLCATQTMAQTSGQPWDWQLSGTPDITVDVAVIDLDPDEVTASQIASLKARGVYTICYVSVGTLEDWRSDVDDFPSIVIGRRYADWPDEAFLDTRRLDILLPLMAARFSRCADLGFDAIEPDNMDGHTNDTGFGLSAQDTVTYVRALADMAHGMGLDIGQKNAGALTKALVDVMDFAVTENCLTDGWCTQMGAYRIAGKGVFAAEYDVSRSDQPRFCAVETHLGLSLIFADGDLNPGSMRCPSP